MSTRRFRPPLKDSASISAAQSASSSFQNSQSQNAHTVLSYCDELHNECKQRDHSFTDHIKADSDDSDVSPVPLPRLFDCRPSKRSAFMRNFSIFPKSVEKNRSILKTIKYTSMKHSVGSKKGTHIKKVAITTPGNRPPTATHSTKPPLDNALGVSFGLDVFDYQATPQPQGETAACNSTSRSLDSSRSEREPTRSRQEQIEIDREVMKTISGIREDIKMIRVKYERRKAERQQASAIQVKDTERWLLGDASSPAGLVQQAEE